MLFLLRCGVPDDRQLDTPILPGERVESVTMPEVPGRRDLKIFDPLPSQYTGGETESLEELTQRPDVSYQGTPKPDPHQVTERVRVIVHGTDAALAAVVSKLMRIDALWVEVAYVPLSPDSLVATVWGIDAATHPRTLLHSALTAPAVSVPLIRDDHGLVTLGLAEITGPMREGEVQPLVGEVIVDSETLYAHDATGRDNHGRKAVFTNGCAWCPRRMRPAWRRCSARHCPGAACSVGSSDRWRRSRRCCKAGRCRPAARTCAWSATARSTRGRCNR